MPFTLKDAHATAGMRTTTGFPPLADYVPQEDSTVTARLKAAGGILIGKTNVPVMLADYQSTNPIFGRTNNPWNIQRTPGGSSGGAAAALAAEMAPFEIGTDLSASIRIPAHFCGLFGLKPTEKRVPLTGLLPGLPTPRSVRIMSCIGPMARTIEDLALLYSIIAGPDERDTEVAPVPIEEVPNLELKNLRIAFAPTFPGFPVAAALREAVEELAKRLSPLRVDGQEVVYWMVSAHSTVFNYTGHPAVVLPYQMDRDGLPIGVQMVGKRWDESRLLAMAKALNDEL